MTNKVLIEKKGGLFNLRPLYDLFSHSVDGIYQVIVKKVRKPRSNDQNGWLWGCMTKDKVVNKHTGEIIEFPGSTATMDTLTFSTYCEKLREYALEYLNIEIPDPDPNWRKADEENTQSLGK